MAGSREEANEAFLNEFEEWYFQELVPNCGFIENMYGAFPPSVVTTTYDNWYEYFKKGGGRLAAADGDVYNSPIVTDPRNGDNAFIVQETVIMPSSSVPRTSLVGSFQWTNYVPIRMVHYSCC